MLERKSGRERERGIEESASAFVLIIGGEMSGKAFAGLLLSKDLITACQ